MNYERVEEEIFGILRQSGQSTNEYHENKIVHELIRPLLQSLNFGVEYQPKISKKHLRPDFVITNLPVQVIGEVKRPEGYEVGKEQLHDYLSKRVYPQSVGIITDGIRWEIYHIKETNNHVTFDSFFSIDLSPVVEEIRTNEITEVGELNSRQNIREFVSVFSQPRFKRLLDEVDLFSTETDVREITEPFETDALELLREEANEKIANQMEQHRFYQSTGFQLGRTAVIAISILISMGAIVIELRPSLSIISLFNLPTVAGITLLSLSAFFGIAGPVYVSSKTEKAPQRMYREYFELAVPDGSSEGITSRKDVLIELLDQSCKVGKAFRGSIDKLLRVMGIAVLLQLVGVLLIAIGLYWVL